MNCQSFKTQIDEAAFTAELHRHLSECAGCRTFHEERECLKAMLAKLENVGAPANFEFGVKAKLNSLPAPSGHRTWARRFAFATPALAAVAVSAFVLTNYNGAPTPETVATTATTQGTSFAPTPVAAPSPPLASEQQIAAANANTTAVTTPTLLKPAVSVPKNNNQLAAQSSQPKQTRNNLSNREDEIVTRTIQEKSVKTITQSVGTATPIIPKDFDPKQKIAAGKALSFFGVDVSEDGGVKAVQTNSAAAENGISAGDKIETVNGQKITEANLENTLQQVTVEVVRGGNKRKITMSVKGNQPK